MIGNDKKRSFMSFNSNDYKGFTFRSGAVKKTTEQNSTFWDTKSNDVDVVSQNVEFCSVVFLTAPLLKVKPL